MLKKLFTIFIVSFLLNLIWENSHSYLYVHYQNGPITRAILLRAALFDAVAITLLAVLFIGVAYFQKRKWYALPFGFLVAIFIEIYALQNGRWAYNELMPIVPLLNTGLTPTIQLGILSYLIFRWKV